VPGSWFKMKIRPEGTAGMKEHFQPSLRDSIFFQLVPALKRRAIFNCPAGTKRARRTQASFGVF
jgi:hypothetical protein